MILPIHFYIFRTLYSTFYVLHFCFQFLKNVETTITHFFVFFSVISSFLKIYTFWSQTSLFRTVVTEKTRKIKYNKLHKVMSFWFLTRLQTLNYCRDKFCGQDFLYFWNLGITFVHFFSTLKKESKKEIKKVE